MIPNTHCAVGHILRAGSTLTRITFVCISISIYCIVDAFPTGTLTVPPAPGYDMHNYISFVAAKPQELSTASHFLKR